MAARGIPASMFDAVEVLDAPGDEAGAAAVAVAVAVAGAGVPSVMPNSAAAAEEVPVELDGPVAVDAGVLAVLPGAVPAAEAGGVAVVEHKGIHLPVAVW